MKRFDAVVNAAADRIRRDLARIDERFPQEGMVITRDEAVKHMQDYGHVYDEQCGAEYCQKWRQMVAQATTGGA